MDTAPYANGVGITNGTNGASHLANGAGPSKVYPPTPPSTHLGASTTSSASTADGMQYTRPPSHNDTIVNHIYTAGFQHGNYADTHLHILNRHYRLHAIILSRSPYLAHLINTSGSNSIHIPLEGEPLITEEGFAIALGYLYSSISTSLVTPTNARSVLAAACLLGGMDDLCIAAYETCKERIALENIADWILFLQLPTSPSLSSSPASPMSPVSSLPGTPVIDDSVPGPTSVLGPYAKRLRDDVFAFLVTTLPQTLQAFPSTAQRSASAAAVDGESGYDVLLRVYTLLPFDIFKHAVESPALPVGVGGDQARFRFAKEAIAARKKQKGGRDEESVVLAFGKTDGGSAVHVARKMKKRPLWKVAK